MKGRVYLGAVIDEEHKYGGVSHPIKERFRVVAGIVGVPTNLEIIIAHKGYPLLFGLGSMLQLTLRTNG